MRPNGAGVFMLNCLFTRREVFSELLSLVTTTYSIPSRRPIETTKQTRNRRYCASKLSAVTGKQNSFAVLNTGCIDYSKHYVSKTAHKSNRTCSNHLKVTRSVRRRNGDLRYGLGLFVSIGFNEKKISRHVWC